MSHYSYVAQDIKYVEQGWGLKKFIHHCLELVRTNWIIPSTCNGNLLLILFPLRQSNYFILARDNSICTRCFYGIPVPLY